MTIDEEKIELRDQIEINRNTQGCNAYYGQTFLYHWRTHFPYNIFKSIVNVYWFCQFNLSKVEAETLALKFGGSAIEHFYEEGVYFISFNDEKLALIFVRSTEFDKLSITTDKI